MRQILPLFLLVILYSCSVQIPSERKSENTFNQSELEFIQGDEDKPMRVFLITSKTDSILLRSKSKYIAPDPNDKNLQLFVKRLHRTVTDSASLGVGIAAPQVGVLRNIIWVQRFDKPNLPFEVYLNPKIIQYSDKKQPCPEGCLSIPNKTATTTNRAYAILLEYDTMKGEHKTEMVEGFTAVVFQHEIDHLNGILFIDHLNDEMNQ